MASRKPVGSLAKALSEFWYGGAGPTHGDLDDVFDEAGLTDYPTISDGSKRERVSQAVLQAADTSFLWPLVQQLLICLADELYLTPSTSNYHEPDVRRLKRALARFGRDVDEDGHLSGGPEPAVAEAAEERLSTPVLRQHIERLRSASRRGDVEHVLGTAKELVESTIAIVLARTGTEVSDEDHLPKRAKKAQQALLLHGAVHDVSGEFGQHVKTTLSSMSAIANAIVELRNLAGTGHGREQPVVGIRPRHAKLVAGAAIVYCEMLLDTLDDPDAPWRDQA